MTRHQAVDKRRVILDAAVRVFARQGFHNCRVSDIAGGGGSRLRPRLPLLRFQGRDAERALHPALVAAGRGHRRGGREEGSSAPGKLETAIAGFIIESYRHDPELMKVIIVEVTRAANSFGRIHLAEIRKAYDSDREDRRRRPGRRETFRDDVDAAFASMLFYGAIEQLLTGWIFGVVPGEGSCFDRAKALVVETICAGLEPRKASGVDGGGQRA